MHVIVLGAGLAGVTTAWYLTRDGHRVTLIDRQPAAGLETSFANGGQISVSHPEPWANPSAPGQILRWLGREDAPLKFRPKTDLAQWSWAAAFLRECLPGRFRKNRDAIAALGQYSLAQLRALRTELNLHYDCSTRGILHLFFTPEEYAKAALRAQALRDYGMDIELVAADRAREIEPALAASRVPIAGGLYAPNDESGDAHRFTQALAAATQAAGATLLFSTTIDALLAPAGSLSGVRVRHADGTSETLRADACVLALGSQSPKLAAQVGEHLAIYPVKGYSVTLPAGPLAPNVSITDESRKLVFSRLGDRLRIAGTAELNGYDMRISPARTQAIIDRTLEIFPDAGDPKNAELWTGLRPATPSNRPYIGASRVKRLYLNTGHGTLGWTLSCGSARSLADIIAGKTPQPAFPFLRR